MRQLSPILLALLLLTACGADSGATDPTPTQLARTATVALPTTTPAPTIPVIGALPEVIEAQQKLADGNYDRAVQLLRRVATTYPDDPEAINRLADAFLQWGRQLIKDSAGSDDQLTDLTIALEKFTSGLAVNPPDPTLRDNLDDRSAVIRAYLDVANRQNIFNGTVETMEISPRRREADAIYQLFDQIYTMDPEFPGVRSRLAEALLDLALSLNDSPAASRDEEISQARTALGFCARAVDLDPTLTAAAECRSAVEARLTQLTATPTPVPTVAPRPSALVVQLLNRDDTPNCISMQISGIPAGGWYLSIDGLNMGAAFDTGNNTRICGLPGHDFTFTILDTAGRAVPGGRGVPARGGDIFVGFWQ